MGERADVDPAEPSGDCQCPDQGGDPWRIIRTGANPGGVEDSTLDTHGPSDIVYVILAISYDNNLLSKQQVTREAILRALADTVLDEGADHFSVQEVADRAGLSHRTVYRHFPSREALLDGMADWLEEWTQERGLPGAAEETEDLPASLEQVFSTFDTEDRMVRALSMIILATGRQPSVRRRRTDAFREKLRTLAPDLPDQEFEASFAVIRMLGRLAHLVPAP